MDKLPTTQPPDRQTLLVAALVSPKAYVCLALFIFGTAAAGSFLIGVGIVFALMPVACLLFHWIFRRHDRPNWAVGQ
jgi:hypothetical protein